MRLFVVRSATAVSMVSALVALGAWSSPSAHAEQSAGTSAAALSEFRTHLLGNDPAGVERFDELSRADRDVIAQYLTEGADFSALTPPADASVTRSPESVTASAGIATWTATTGEDVEKTTARAATYKVHSYADETFTLAGITISRTRVWADYTTGSGAVRSLTDYGCQLVANNDPFSSISISKQSAILSGGRASYKCYVAVKRGVPTPWGQVSTTTRSAYQYMNVAGPGITGHGWI